MAEYKIGDTANGYVLTAYGWVPQGTPPTAPPVPDGPPAKSGGLPWWGWLLIVGVPSLFVFGFIGLVALAQLGADSTAEDDPDATRPNAAQDDDQARIDCIRWNGEWVTAVRADEYDDPASVYFPILERQPQGCDVTAEQFVYDLWHGTWESAKEVEGWPQCVETLQTGDPVLNEHGTLGCADGYIKVAPTVTECTNGLRLIAIDDTGWPKAGLSAIGFEGDVWTNLGDVPFTANALYADMLEACTTE